MVSPSQSAELGSAAIAHSAVRTDEPATEDFVSLLEPFIDTVVDLSDALVFVLAIPNLLGLYLLAPVVKEEILSYQERLNRN